MATNSTFTNTITNLLATNSSSCVSNTTTPNTVNWTWAPAFTLAIQICAFLTNGSLAFLFIRNPSLFTPFTIYIVNLSISNVLCSILFDTIDMVASLYSTWWLGDTWCTFYQYADWAITGTMSFSHLLIALNRFWAVTYPISYRKHHTKKFSICACVTVWIFVHACNLPGILLDAYVYRPKVTETTGCNVGTYVPNEWPMTMQLLIFDVPLVIIIIIVPVVCYKVWRRARVEIKPGPHLLSRGTSHHSGNNISGLAPTAGNSGAPTVNTGNLDASSAGQGVLSGAGLRSRRQKSTRGILALVMMTTTLMIAYIPENTYFTLKLVFGIRVAGMYSIVNNFYVFMPVMDPLWFMFTLSDIRQAFYRTYLPSFA